MIILVLDENTEPRCSLSRKKNVNHVFDVINKITNVETSMSINSVEELESYLRRSCSLTNTQAALSTVLEENPPAVVTSDGDTVEKHFMCESDEERDSWLRALRCAR